MGIRVDTRHLAALTILLSACTIKEDLGDLDETESSAESDTEGDSDEGPGETTAGSGESTGGDPTATTTGPNPPMPGVGPAAVDILFVVDNSGSMGEEQAQLSASIGDLLGALQTGGLDYRIAITTTDNGNPMCPATGPEMGNFVFSSCRGRLGDFVFEGSEPIDAKFACEDSCTLESVATTDGVPWIENGGSNLADGVSIEAALPCLLPQGINGCGFEAPLESMYAGLRRALDPTEDEYGFLRPDAHLMVILISDEADCSSGTDEIFLRAEDGGNEVFWSLPDEQTQAPSAVCWNAGVACTGDPAAYDDCVARDKAVDGSPTTDPDQAVLHALGRYQGLLDELRAEKAESHAQVFVFGLLGVPTDYPTTRTITYAQGPDGTDPDSFQANFGIGPGCTSPTAQAVPPVRVRELSEDNALTQSSPLYSICAAGYGGAVASMVAEVNAFVGE